MNQSEPRVERKDVVRNRQRILDAARHVFAEQGLDSTLDDVAAQAGLGAGTAYRHFKNRRELIAAIFADAVQVFRVDADVALAVDDPWDGFVVFMETFAKRQASDRGLHQVFIGNHSLDLDLDRDQWDGLLSAIARVVDRAKAASRVRADLEVSDLVVFFAMMGPAYDVSIATSTAIWRRHLDDFLRASRIESSPVIDIPPAVLVLPYPSDVRSGLH
jgi:AcrR family transcriptional regulator